MSTTIYLHRIISQEEKLKIQNLAIEEKIIDCGDGEESVESIISSIKKEKNQGIAHSACGWKLRFYKNPALDGNFNKESLYNYLEKMLESGKWEIRGYGLMSLQDLKDLEEEKSDGYTDSTYPNSTGIYDEIAPDNSVWESYDFFCE